MRMNCICGEVLSNSAAPNDIQLRVYTDREWDALLQNDIIEAWNIPEPAIDVWRCPKCERIHVFGGERNDEGFPLVSKVYKLEEDWV